MEPVPLDLTLAPWRELREHLAGYFAARAQGLLASEFVLSNRGGEEFGRLRVHGPEGAELEVGSTRVKIERTARSRYRVLTGDAETLVAEFSGSSGALRLRCVNHTYEARLNLLRNMAVARSSGDKEVARIAGGLTNRNYEVVFDVGDEGSLPVTIFLLYYTVTLRRRAFLTSTRGGETSNSP
jgi:hypothetical protein